MTPTNAKGTKAVRKAGAKKTAVPRKKSPPRAKRPLKARAQPVTAAPSLVVGIGASAGGIDALKGLFSSMPANSGMAFVVIQHLAPDHESLMASLLAATTDMQVAQIKRRTLLEPNHVYVMPPNKYVTIKNGYVSLTKPVERRGHQMAVDFFFRALAEDQFERAVGVILSGTGSDGSSGIRAIKDKGGFSLVQDPHTAAYDGMPRSAVGTGMADQVLAIDKMAIALLGYAGHPYVTGTIQSDTVQDHLTGILALLKTRLKRDFYYYKKSTLVRRITRRMGVVHVHDMKSYLAHLRKDPAELNNLFKDLLIGVTQFFRDPDAFAALAKTVVPAIIKNHAADQPIRIWVPGCAGGEEAYSLAMLFIECLGAKQKHIKVQIFATDINADALESARNGVFSESIAADISARHLSRFFGKEGDTYRATKQLRDCIAFAEQNLISDPPFSKLDLVSCRNLLIYIEPELQTKIMALFHYTLNEGGYLFLGSSETTGRQSNMFKRKDGKAKIFQRRDHVQTQAVNFPLVAGDSRRPPPPLALQAKARPRSAAYADITHRMLSQAYAPASVLINGDGDALYLFGPTDRYLKLPSGEPQLNVISMARNGLKSKLRSLIQRVARSGRAETLDHVPIDDHGDFVDVSVTVSPVDDVREEDGLFLLAFVESRDPPQIKTKRRKIIDDESTAIKDMERELQSAREDQQSTIEEMETANEELKAANEEAMSMNEELQSSNEELETSKEEMQSLNEELGTVNAELAEKVDQLEASRNDFANLLANTDIATIFLDEQMRIKIFTPAAQRLFSFRPSDSGRRLADFSKTFMDPALLTDADQVLAKLVPIEVEVVSNDGISYARRILPYRTEDNKIAGVVITFVDISAVKKAEIEALRLATIVRDSNDAVTLMDMKGKILAWNHGAEKMYGYDAAEAIGMNMRALVPAKERRKAHGLLAQAASIGDGESLTAKRQTKDGRVLDVWLTTTALSDDRGQPCAIATTERDVTERNRAEEQIKHALAEKETLIREIHHRVKNNLQVMMSLLAMQERRTKNKEAKEALRDTTDRVRVMALVHQHLYESSEKEGIGIKSYIEMIVRDLATVNGASERKISVDYQADDAIVGVENALSCCHIISELMSNAFKYGFPGKRRGKISVSLRNVGKNDCQIDVSDNGVGLPDDFDFDRDAGLGLQLVHNWVRGRGWKLSYESKAGIHYTIKCKGMRL